MSAGIGVNLNYVQFFHGSLLPWNRLARLEAVDCQHHSVLVFVTWAIRTAQRGGLGSTTWRVCYLAPFCGFCFVMYRKEADFWDAPVSQ